jgi:hypothetical protein
MRISPQAILLSIVIASAGCSGSGGGHGQGQGRSELPPGSNSPPTIAGMPDRSVREGESYDFRPSASDADGDDLRFEIKRKPAWARFDPSTGRLWGTPDASDAGAFEGIEIRVTDGRATAALGPFSIAVNQFEAGSATLSWNPPTENRNGTVLTDLAGYRIYFGRSPASLNSRIELDNPGLARYVIENLSPAKWYFAMTAVNRRGIESRRSRIVSKRVA